MKDSHGFSMLKKLPVSTCCLASSTHFSTNLFASDVFLQPKPSGRATVLSTFTLANLSTRRAFVKLLHGGAAAFQMAVQSKSFSKSVSTATSTAAKSMPGMETTLTQPSASSCTALESPPAPTKISRNTRVVSATDPTTTRLSGAVTFT